MVPLFLLHLFLLEWFVDWPRDELPLGKQSKNTLLEKGGINRQGNPHLLRNSKRLPVGASGENSTCPRGPQAKGMSKRINQGPGPVLVPCIDWDPGHLCLAETRLRYKWKRQEINSLERIWSLCCWWTFSLQSVHILPAWTNRPTLPRPGQTQALGSLQTITVVSPFRKLPQQGEHFHFLRGKQILFSSICFCSLFLVFLTGRPGGHS